MCRKKEEERIKKNTTKEFVFIANENILTMLSHAFQVNYFIEFPIYMLDVNIINKYIYLLFFPLCIIYMVIYDSQTEK